MAAYFYPGCKIKAAYPRESALLEQYVVAKTGATTLGCCRKDTHVCAADDTAYFVCNNCSNILGESSPANNVVSVWSLIDNDPEFDVPSYAGRRMAIQDCWLASNRPDIHRDVRSLAEKMGIELVELPNNKEKSTFCGTNRFVAPSQSNVNLAPKRWGENMGGALQLMPKEKWDAWYQHECASYPCEEALCNCIFCADGLRRGGIRPVHILQLLFPE